MSAVEESMLKGKRDGDESVGQTMRDRTNLHTILERKAESAIRGENEAQKKSSEIQEVALLCDLPGASSSENSKVAFC